MVCGQAQQVDSNLSTIVLTGDVSDGVKPRPLDTTVRLLISAATRQKAYLNNQELSKLKNSSRPLSNPYQTLGKRMPMPCSAGLFIQCRRKVLLTNLFEPPGDSHLS
jgi:hypothetical protein